MSRWTRRLIGLAARLEERTDAIRREAAIRLAAPRRLEIVPYAGFGSSAGARLKGRVLEAEKIGESRHDAGAWENLAAAWRRLETDEVAGARVVALHDGREHVATTDLEGFFTFDLGPLSHAGEELRWVSVPITIVEPASLDGEPVRATGRVLLAPGTASFGVISDVDDTVLHTEATRLIRMARHTLFGNARTRLPVPGMPALLAALTRGPRGGKMRNPVFYVSSSPWNLYQLIVEFFQLQEMPAGPLLLRDWGLTADTQVSGRHHVHKLAAIERVFAECPGLPFILIGDSGQEDPEIYREVVQRHPGRVQAVYIRRVRRDSERDHAVALLADEVHAAGSEMLVTDDARAAARHAAERRWIAAEAVELVDQAAREGVARPRA